MPPTQIVFSVKTPPRAGYLVMLSRGASVAGPPSWDPVQSFSQEAVDAGRVLYLHSRPEAWSDAFSLDVGSGLGAPLEGVRVELEVLPTTIPLEAQNFSVPEGGSRALAPPLLRVAGPYFPALPGLELLVLEPPLHGALRREEAPQAGTLSAFSWKEVLLSGLAGGWGAAGGLYGWGHPPRGSREVAVREASALGACCCSFPSGQSEDSPIPVPPAALHPGRRGFPRLHLREWKRGGSPSLPHSEAEHEGCQGRARAALRPARAWPSASGLPTGRTAADPLCARRE